MNNGKYRRLTSWLIAAWFVFALLAAALHLIQPSPTAPPIVLGLFALTPVIVFVAWFRTSPEFQAWVLALNPRTLTVVQSWRIAGYVFLALYTYGILPGSFALPAGWGDFFIGLTAPLVAMKLVSSSHRAAFILWQILGMADLVTAVGIGAMSGILKLSAISTAPMTVLPLSLIPTFAVPLFFILHNICIAQARRWPETAQVRNGEPVPSSAI